MDIQMRKAVLEMCVLYMLKDGPLYGYEIMKAVRQVFPDVYEGSIYTILRRLKATGYTDITERASQSGPPRKYYGVTEPGREYLDQMLNEWRKVVAGVSAFGILN